MKQLFSKLFKVQEEIGAIAKDKTNPHFKSKYFDINTLLENLKPVLNKNGILVNQPIVSQDGRTFLRTIVCDAESGEFREFDFEIFNDQNPQKIGSSISYFRRYALQSLFMLEAEDDDGNTASSVSFQVQKPAPKPIDKALNDSQAVQNFIADLDQQPQKKICPVCKNNHTGKYPKCLNCWKLDQDKT